MASGADHTDAEYFHAEADRHGAAEHGVGETTAPTDVEATAQANPDVEAPAQADGAKDTTSMAGAAEHGGKEDNVQGRGHAQIFQITI